MLPRIPQHRLEQVLGRDPGGVILHSLFARGGLGRCWRLELGKCQEMEAQSSRSVPGQGVTEPQQHSTAGPQADQELMAEGLWISSTAEDT